MLGFDPWSDAWFHQMGQVTWWWLSSRRSSPIEQEITSHCPALRIPAQQRGSGGWLMGWTWIRLDPSWCCRALQRATLEITPACFTTVWHPDLAVKVKGSGFWVSGWMTLFQTLRRYRGDSFMSSSGTIVTWYFSYRDKCIGVLLICRNRSESIFVSWI